MPAVAGTDTVREGEGVQKMGNLVDGLLFFQIGLGTGEIQGHVHHYIGGVLRVGGGFLGIVRMCSSHDVFVTRTGSIVVVMVGISGGL